MVDMLWRGYYGETRERDTATHAAGVALLR
jgi:hypothetical protein